MNIVKEGMIWRVGSGENIKIWEDPWVPANLSRKPNTAQGAHLLTRVAELIDPVTNSWDLDLVNQTFSAADAANILKIPLCEQQEDFIAWHFDSKGHFSVKSAYKIQLSLTQQQTNSEMVEGSTRTNWRKKTWHSIWKLNCPPKVQHFLWRFAHNSHPMRMNIERRGVVLDTRCSVCGRLFEDGGHLFLRCEEVKKVWRATHLENERQSLLVCHSPLEVLEYIFSQTERTKLLVVALLWKWSNERNRVRHGEKRLTPDAFSSQVLLEVAEWGMFFSPQQSAQTTNNSKWRAPPDEFVKVNVDGAYNQTTASGGWVCIAKAPDGDILFAAAGPLSYLSEGDPISREFWYG